MFSISSLKCIKLLESVARSAASALSHKEADSRHLQKKSEINAIDFIFFNFKKEATKSVTYALQCLTGRVNTTIYSFDMWCDSDLFSINDQLTDEKIKDKYCLNRGHFSLFSFYGNFENWFRKNLKVEITEFWQSMSSTRISLVKSSELTKWMFIGHDAPMAPLSFESL